MDTYRSVYEKVSNDEATFHGMKGETSGNRIDFIFSNDELFVDKATIERGKVLDKYPSDHYPITATIYFRQS
jgi:endonuclease/exonuclease/phosphatase family metal-dependent hydrolase